MNTTNMMNLNGHVINLDTTSVLEACYMLTNKWFTDSYVDMCRPANTRVRIAPVIEPKRKGYPMNNDSGCFHEDLIITCRFLARNHIYDCCVDGEGRPNNHWSSTKDDMEKQLGRKLFDLEITCLSLGRHFGPTPSITDEDRSDLGWFLADGCVSTDWYTWEGLGNALAKYDREVL